MHWSSTKSTCCLMFYHVSAEGCYSYEPRELRTINSIKVFQPPGTNPPGRDWLTGLLPRVSERLANTHLHCTCFRFDCRELIYLTTRRGRVEGDRRPPICKYPHLPIWKDTSRTDLVCKERNVHVAGSEGGRTPSRRLEFAFPNSQSDSPKHVSPSSSPTPSRPRSIELHRQCSGCANMIFNRRYLAILIAVDVALALWFWATRWPKHAFANSKASPQIQNNTLGVCRRRASPGYPFHRLTPFSSSTSLSSTSPRVPIVGMP